MKIQQVSLLTGGSTENEQEATPKATPAFAMVEIPMAIASIAGTPSRETIIPKTRQSIMYIKKNLAT